MHARNCLSYWFPRLVDAGIPVPKTEIIRLSDGGAGIYKILFGENELSAAVIDAVRELANQIRDAAENIGLGSPVFLRTGQGSGKQNWKNCCYLADPMLAEEHISALVEWSETVDFVGLPFNVWCVREMLPTKPVAILPLYGDMPLVPEVRAFVRDGKVICSHDYWPLGAIVEGLPRERKSEAERLYSLFWDTIEHREAAHALARKVAKAFAADGAWSVDLLPTKRGWYVTDMAEAHRSFHWEGCPVAGSFAKETP